MLYVLPADKANHFVYGVAIYWVAFVFAHGLLMLPEAANWALVPLVLFACGKEASDYRLARAQKARGEAPTHTSDPLDALFTVVGGLLCYLLLLINAI
jgi:hypothetical protein